jgi:integrase
VPARQQANERLAKDGLGALPEPLTQHALRRTFASVLFALGHDPRYVMDQIGHSNPTVTFVIYAQVMRVSDEDRAGYWRSLKAVAWSASGRRWLRRP